MKTEHRDSSKLFFGGRDMTEYRSSWFRLDVGTGKVGAE